MKNVYLAVGIAVVVLIMIVFTVVRNRISVSNSNAKPTPTPVIAQNQEEKQAISVSKHTPARAAVIDEVTVEKPGFVVVAENQNGAPGAILGISELLQKGKHENVVIALSRKTVSSEELFAQVYTDNGDGNFDSQDEVVKEANGNPLMVQFLVSSETSGFQIPATGLGEDSN